MAPLKPIKNRTGKIVKRTLITIAVIVVLLAAGIILMNVRNRRAQVATSEQNNILSQTSVQRSFAFAALDRNAETDGELNLFINQAEKTTQVLIQGKPANAKGDKAFLVLNLEIENTDTIAKYIAPVNLIRLVGDSDKKFAPDIHSDVVEIQPISTKITRVGFVIDRNQKTFNLQVGELDGEKEDIQISL